MNDVNNVGEHHSSSTSSQTLTGLAKTKETKAVTNITSWVDAFVVEETHEGLDVVIFESSCGPEVCGSPVATRQRVAIQHALDTLEREFGVTRRDNILAGTDDRFEVYGIDDLAVCVCFSPIDLLHLQRLCDKGVK